MKRDWYLIRQILFDAERGIFGGESEKEKYHNWLLCDAGMIKTSGGLKREGIRFLNFIRPIRRFERILPYPYASFKYCEKNGQLDKKGNLIDTGDNFS